MQFIKAICDLYKLGELKQASLCAGSQRLWQLQTEKGSYAIKQLSSDMIIINHAIQGERIAAAFAERDIAVINAISHESKQVIEVADQKFLIFHWQTGEVLPFNAVAPHYAYKIGNLLAHLHLAKIVLPDVTLSRWQNFQTLERDELLELIQRRGIINPPDFLNQLILWIEKCFHAKQQINDSFVISHGDLLQANVIWENNNPWLIDWEAAGWIHPQIELVGVLLNWSGVNIGELNRESFMNIMEGYRTAGGEINIDENILWASLGSWFAWLVFNLRQYMSANKKVDKEIIHTITTLQSIVSNFSHLLNLINIAK